MLVFESGVFEGGISGGCLEGDALKRSQIAIFKNKPSIVTYDTSQDDENQIGVGLGCNGVIDVLISPITSQSNTISLLEKCLQKRKSHILITVTAANEKSEKIALGQSYYYDTTSREIENCDHKELKGLLSKDASKVLETKESNIFKYTIDDSEINAFIEIIPPQFHLAIFGDNYDVYPLISLARVMDWEVSLVGNLKKLKKDKLQSIKSIYSKYENIYPEIDNRTAIVLMAHDYKTDVRNLEWAIHTVAPYIASLGPKKRFEKIIKDFENTGCPLSPSQLERIFAPCGLEIGANTPEEIATSIIAEILSVFAGKNGGLLRNKNTPIHDRN
jgi:xanthine/CO dehydrogenase XdhC/CoxF family maturation factor